jgi:hypothetical protein
MAQVQKLATRMSEYAERVSRVADAAEGKRPREKGRLRRWVVLPAAGATIYAVVRSDFFTRQAKDIVGEAKTRASELPDDLVARVRETADTPSGENGGPAKETARKGSTRRASGTRRARPTGKSRTPSR